MAAAQARLGNAGRRSMEDTFGACGVSATGWVTPFRMTSSLHTEC
jgi:hypothetical protein